MATIDIRTMERQKEDSIRFADESEDYCSLLQVDEDDGSVMIESDTNGNVAVLKDREHIQGLIKALEYALENGWGDVGE